jgi:hypothetical protein
MDGTTDGSMNRADDVRGPWSTALGLAVAIAPLAAAVALALVADSRPEILGPQVTPAVGPALILLVVLYPAIVALARTMAYAPTTVLIVASIAPSAVYAARLLLDARPTDRLGNPVVTTATIVQRALPPAILAVGAFIAIEIATAAMRRGVAIGVFGGLIAAGVLGLSIYAGLVAIALAANL